MDPLQIIKGEIKPPYIEITNDKIVKRHMYAVALAMFWTKKPRCFGRVNQFFPYPGETATFELRRYLAENPTELESSLKRIVPEVIWPKLGVEDWSWVSVSYTHLDVYKRQVKQVLPILFVPDGSWVFPPLFCSMLKRSAQTTCQSSCI